MLNRAPTPDHAARSTSDAPTTNGAAPDRNTGGAKAHNLQTVLLTLLQRGPVSRIDLTRLTGFSATTITHLAAELLEFGLINEAGKDVLDDSRPGAGRPPTLLRLTPSARCAVGLHISPHTLQAGVIDLLGRPQALVSVPQQPNTTPEHTLQRAVDLISETIGQTHASQNTLVGIGVGASGLTDGETGSVLLAPHLGWRDVPVRAILSPQVSHPVIVNNDIRGMALAESLFGAARGINSLVFVHGRDLVGAGFVVGGRIHHGSHAGAGEIGHMTMIPIGGALCRCGNTGCLETLVSEDEITRQARALAARAPDGLLAAHLKREPADAIEQIFTAARAGDRNAQGLLTERAFFVGTALANLVNTLNPDMIILGGWFAAGADLMLPVIEETMQRRSFTGLGHKTALGITALGREAGVIGAAALALDAFFYRRHTS